MTCCNHNAERGLCCPRGCQREPICNSARVTARCAGDCCYVATVSAVSEEVCLHVVDLSLRKTVTPTSVRAGEPVTYTIAIRNDSTLPITSLLLTDPTLAQYFEVGTIRINGAVAGGNPSTGIPVPGIGAGGTAVVTIQATPLSGGPSVIENVARVEFDFTTICGGRSTAAAVSNQVLLRVMEPGLELTKEADQCYLSCEEPVVTYTLTATNTGNCPLTNVVVVDSLPDGLSYVPGTTSVNDGQPVDRDPGLGVDVGALGPQESATVAFQAALDCEE